MLRFHIFTTTSEGFFYPSRVENADGKEEIIELFADQVFKLYNSVSYNNEAMDVLRDESDILVDTQCTDSVKCTDGTHSIPSRDVSLVINRLVHNKNDSDSEVVSDHIIYALPPQPPPNPQVVVLVYI